MVSGCALSKGQAGREKVRCLACSYNYPHYVAPVPALATGAHELLATVDWQRGGDSRCGGAKILAVLGVCRGSRCRRCMHVRDVGTHTKGEEAKEGNSMQRHMQICEGKGSFRRATHQVSSHSTRVKTSARVVKRCAVSGRA